MPSIYRVRVSKDYLVFSAAHFITLGENFCERLHGHNYRVAAEVSGPLDPIGCVIDFLLLRDTLQQLVAELDHHVLLPGEHSQIRVTAGENQVEAAFADRRWSFPRGDCIILPVTNTTAEKLAEYLAHRLLEELQSRHNIRPQAVRLEVDECYGQIGICEIAQPPH
jgi:6-pyruvoyltetrahydropterin/6-carboxytetrahydropterin synthase